MSVLTITCRGLFEAVSDQNMLSNLTRRLDRNRFRVEEFSPWAAGFGDYDVALERTAGLLAERVRRVPGPVVLAGYSGGAAVVGHALTRLSISDRQKVAYTVLAADPNMPTATYQVVGSRVSGYSGIAGERMTIRDLPRSSPVVWVADKGDPICQLPPGSPLRRLAAVLTAMRPGPGSLVSMQANLARIAYRDYSWSAYRQAAADLDGYLRRGSHVLPYPALLARVGDDINRTVR